MAFTLPKLEYSFDALEPYIDTATMEVHYSKHHQTYLDKFVAALEKYPQLQDQKVEDMLKDLNSIPEDIRMAVRNMGGGYYNHNIFWANLAPNSKMLPEVEKALLDSFPSVAEFKKEFEAKALSLFGSGWTWLVKNPEGKLEIINTSNQDNPISSSEVKLLLALDVWEHAYYLKYQNRRAEYVANWWNVVNWEHVAKGL